MGGGLLLPQLFSTQTMARTDVCNSPKPSGGITTRISPSVTTKLPSAVHLNTENENTYIVGDVEWSIGPPSKPITPPCTDPLPMTNIIHSSETAGGRNLRTNCKNCDIISSLEDGQLLGLDGSPEVNANTNPSVTLCTTYTVLHMGHLQGDAEVQWLG